MRRSVTFGSLWALSIFMVSTAWAQVPSFDANSSDLPSMARSLDLGETFVLRGMSLDGLETTRNLVLQRFEVFTPDAKVVVQTGDGPQTLAPPNNVYLSGFIEGSPSSYAYLSVREDNSMRGVVSELGRYYMMAAGGDTGVESTSLYSREVAPDELAEEMTNFQCGTDNLDGITQSKRDGVEVKPKSQPKRTVFPSRGKVSAIYQVEVAMETDSQYYSLFGNATDAASYLADLIGFSSGIYEDELSTAMVISHVSLWGPGSTDPWSGTNPTCLLFQLGKYWNDNNGSISRTITHFVSGVNNGGGVAWVGVLCDGAFTYNSGSGCGLSPQTSNYGGAYGYSGDIDNEFNINAPSSVWDIIVVAHEIGHNFNSPHTHCYAGLNGNANDIDECYGSQSGCYSGFPNLPSGCPGTGQGCGTIMSYCHLSFAGGLSNVSLTLGLGHPYGIEPERVPTRMRNHVVSTNGLNPVCLVELYPSILGDWPDPSTVLDILEVLF